MLALTLTLVGMNGSVLVATATGLFVTLNGAGELPQLTIAAALFLALATVGYDHLARHSARRTRHAWLLGVGVAIVVASRLGFSVVPGLAAYAAYILVNILHVFLQVEAWDLVGDAFDVRSAKAKVPVLTGIYAMGTFVGGLLPLFRNAVGGSQNVFVSSVLMLVLIGFALRACNRMIRPSAERGNATKAAVGLGRLLLSPLNISVSLIAFAFSVAAAVSQYQHLSAAAAHFDHEQLSAVVGVLRGAIAAGKSLFSLFLVGWLFTRVGLRGGLLLTPLAIVALGLLAFFAPSLAVFFTFRIALMALEGAFLKSGFRLAFGAAPPADRRALSTFSSGAILPASEALGAVLIMGLGGQVSLAQLSLVAVGAGVIGLVGAWLVRAAYVHALSDGLRCRQLQPLAVGAHAEALDSHLEARQKLLESLGAVESDAVLASLALLTPSCEPEVLSAVTRLLTHPSPLVRAQALSFLRTAQAPESLAPVLRLLARERDEWVCREGLATVAALSPRGEPRVGELIHRWLSDPQTAPGLRGDSVVVLLGSANLADILGGARVLFELAHHELVEHRIAAAKALGAMARGAIPRELTELMGDPVPAVQRAALRSAVLADSVEAVETVAAHARNPALVSAVASALARSPLLDACHERVLALGPGPAAALAQALGKRADQASVELLATIYPQLPALARVKAARRLEELRGNGLRASAARGRACLERTLGERALVLALGAGLERLGAPGAGSVEWLGAIRTELTVAGAVLKREVLHLLVACSEEPLQVDRARRSLDEGPGLRAQALEVLESSAPSGLGRVAVAILDQPIGVASWRLIVSEYPLVSSALEAPMALLGRFGSTYLDWLLKAHSHVAALPGAAADDAAHPDEVIAMLPTLEKVIFLRSVPIFAGLRGDDLMVVASAMEVRHFRAGEVLFERGQRAEEVFVVRQGSVDICVGGKVVAAVGERDVLGETAALDGSLRTATAVAHGSCLLLALSRAGFEEILDSHPEITRELLRVTTSRLRDLLEPRVDAVLAELELRLAAEQEPRARFELTRECDALLDRAARHHARIPHLDELERLARLQGSPVLLIVALSRRLGFDLRRGDRAGAVARLELLRAAGRGSEVAEARCEVTLAEAAFERAAGRDAQAGALLERALEQASGAKDLRKRIRTSLLLGELSLRAGRPVEAESWLLAAKELARTHGDTELEAEAVLGEAQVEGAVGNFDDAAARAHEALVKARRVGARRVEVAALLEHARALAAQGDRASAASKGRAAHALACEVAEPELTSRSCALLATLCQGDEALELAREALRSADSLDDPLLRAEACVALVAAQVDRDPEEAVREANDAQARARAAGLEPPLALLYWHALALEKTGQGAAAAALLVRAQGLLHDMAAALTDVRERGDFLEHIPLHRALLQKLTPATGDPARSSR